MNKILIINGPNLNLLGEREQSQYGSIDYEQLKKNCLDQAKKLNIELEFQQSNIDWSFMISEDQMLINPSNWKNS